MPANSVDLPLGASINAKGVAATCTTQSGVIKQCPAYPSTPAVQSAVTDMDTAVAALDVTLGKIDNIEAEAATLKATRDVQVGTVRIKHDSVRSALNTASNGDSQAAQAWVGKLKARAKPVAVSAGTAPPEGASLAVIKSRPGSVLAKCTAEAGAQSYMFQSGSDPTHPDSWPPAAVSKGHTFKLHNLPAGQILYLRIAIVRRGSVQSQWTQVLQVLVH